MLPESREHLHLVSEQSLLVLRKVVPVLNRLRLGSQFRTLRNYTKLFLVREGNLPLFVPTVIELARVFVDVLLRCLVRCVRGSRGVIDEEWLGRRK